MSANFPGSVLLQSPSTHETRTARMAALLLDGIGVHSCELEHLGGYQVGLRTKQMVPVGSVEFVRQAMAVSGLNEPPPFGYPDALRPYLHRDVQLRRLDQVQPGCFVKPVATKLFNGFVWATAPGSMDEHDHEQMRALHELPAGTMVWTSPPVNFVAEWRYYIDAKGSILGNARYDPDGADDAPLPDLATVRSAIEALSCDVPIGLDVGVLVNGQTAVVEVNPAWALGLYGNAVEPKAYLHMLSAYWTKIVSNQATPAARVIPHRPW